MDDLPPDLPADESTKLQAAAVRQRLPDVLTPVELATLAYPQSASVEDRRVLLQVICEALSESELRAATQPKTLADMHPAIAARWSEKRPPFNPTIGVLFWDTGEPLEPQYLRHGFPQPNYDIGIQRDEFRRWLAAAGLEIPAHAPLRRWWVESRPPQTSAAGLRAKRAVYGAGSHLARESFDWRPVVAEARELMNRDGLSASDAARRVAKKRGLNGADAAPLSGKAKTLANRLTQGNAAPD